MRFALVLLLLGGGCPSLQKCIDALQNCTAPCSPALGNGGCYCACPEPSPTPSPTPTPEPTPTPTPDSTPEPTPPGCLVSMGCAGCQTTPDDGDFAGLVRAAEAVLFARHPSRFVVSADTVQLSGDIESSTEWFVSSLAEEIRSKGYCSALDGRTVGVKARSDGDRGPEPLYSEQYESVTPSGRVVVVKACTCALTPPATPSPAACHLPPMPDCSEDEDSCCALVEDSGLYADAISVSQAMLIARYPARFARDGKGTYLVHGATDAEWYGVELARTIHERSPTLCAMADEDEIAIKESNDLSEEYDVLTSKYYVRRPHKTAECRPSWW